MKTYEFLPHMADVKFRAYGKTLNKAFENAAYALTDVITDHKKIKALKEKTISAESEDEKALLYDFLEQFLILLDSEGFLLSKIKSLKIEKKDKKAKDKKLKIFAKIAGDNKPEKYQIKTHVKAVTYQEMEIKKEKGVYMLQVVADI